MEPQRRLYAKLEMRISESPEMNDSVEVITGEFMLDRPEQLTLDFSYEKPDGVEGELTIIRPSRELPRISLNLNEAIFIQQGRAMVTVNNGQSKAATELAHRLLGR